MNKLNTLKRFFKSECSVTLRLLNRYNKVGLWNRYANFCKNIGLKKTILILSFDCDTNEDIEVVWDVHTKLSQIGIMPVYAVPGELLKRGAAVYQKIFEIGAEFINHGGKEHTYFDEKKSRYASCFFYEQQSKEALIKDISEGHEILKDVLGCTVQGWRTPHFGTFNKKEDLNFLYGHLIDFGYKFSTSTLPYKLYQYGPILYTEQKIYEIPVTGMFSEPFNILDTWAFFAAPDRSKSKQNYLEECKMISEFSLENPILINVYGDPSHIYDQPEFFEGMKMLSQNAKSTNFSELLKIIK